MSDDPGPPYYGSSLTVETTDIGLVGASYASDLYPDSPDLTLLAAMSVAQSESDERLEAAKELWARVYTLMEQTAGDLRAKVDVLREHWKSKGRNDFVQRIGDALKNIDEWQKVASVNISHLGALASAVSAFQNDMRVLWIECQYEQKINKGVAVEQARGYLRTLMEAYQAPFTEQPYGPTQELGPFRLGPTAYTGPLNARLVSPDELERALSRFLPTPGGSPPPPPPSQAGLPATPTHPSAPAAPPPAPTGAGAARPPAPLLPTSSSVFPAVRPSAPYGLAPTAFPPPPATAGPGGAPVAPPTPATPPGVPAARPPEPRAPGGSGLDGRNTPGAPPPRGSGSRPRTPPNLSGRDGNPPGQTPPAKRQAPRLPGRGGQPGGPPPSGCPAGPRTGGPRLAGRTGNSPVARVVPPEIGPEVSSPPGAAGPTRSPAPSLGGRRTTNADRPGAGADVQPTSPAALRPHSPTDDALAPTVSRTELGNRSRPAATNGPDSTNIRAALAGRTANPTRPAVVASPPAKPVHQQAPKKVPYETNETNHERVWWDGPTPEPVILGPDEAKPRPDQTALGSP